MKIFEPDIVGKAEAQPTSASPSEEVTFHSHGNKAALDKISESNGRLLFGGKPVRGTENIAAYLDSTITEAASAATLSMEDFVLPAQCLGSRADVRLLPSATVNVPIKIGADTVAQLTISSAGVCQFVGPSMDTNVPAGSRIEFVMDALANTGCGDLSLVLQLVAV